MIKQILAKPIGRHFDCAHASDRRELEDVQRPAGTMSFFERFRPLVEDCGHCEIVVCPSFLDLATAVTATRGTSIQVGAQNLHWAKEGAFTGEVSAARIRASGCSHVIIGHSERCEYFGEQRAQENRSSARRGTYPDRLRWRARKEERRSRAD